jgi:hypothetical protein
MAGRLPRPLVNQAEACAGGDLGGPRGRAFPFYPGGEVLDAGVHKHILRGGRWVGGIYMYCGGRVGVVRENNQRALLAFRCGVLPRLQAVLRSRVAFVFLPTFPAGDSALEGVCPRVY